MNTNCARRGIGGQAMIELMAGLVAVVVLVAGLIQLVTLTRIDTSVMLEARAMAGRDSMSMLYHDGNPDYIRDWEPGADRKPYTRDDEATSGDTARFVNMIVSRAGRTESDWETLGRAPNNRISLLSSGQDPARAFGLVRGYDSRETNLMPAVQSLLYHADSIEIESEVWMTWTTGIY